jgi:hypothetical protein
MQPARPAWRVLHHDPKLGARGASPRRVGSGHDGGDGAQRVPQEVSVWTAIIDVFAVVGVITTLACGVLAYEAFLAPKIREEWEDHAGSSRHRVP